MASADSGCSTCQQTQDNSSCDSLFTYIAPRVDRRGKTSGRSRRVCASKATLASPKGWLFLRSGPGGTGILQRLRPPVLPLRSERASSGVTQKITYISVANVPIPGDRNVKRTVYSFVGVVRGAVYIFVWMSYVLLDAAATGCAGDF